ncbi:MAG TPA: GTP pyrophosphokinase family protein [Candidatus Anaerofilum faecale]|nr:GTP pyrophosphokinase family protein [Candidatus Anaerofilum faecale]
MSSLSTEQNELLHDFFADDASQFLDRMAQFNELMMKYNSAIREVQTKLQILNDELSLRGRANPIDSIRTRVKKPLSIAEKLRRRGKEVSVEAIFENLNDVAGIRVICPFIDDIYAVADMLARQDDITVLAVKDYIKNPKPNGYRSYHMIVEVPVFFSNYKQPMRVEVQIRTVAMDFWASLEHQMRYKNNSEASRSICDDLKKCADTIARTDEEMQRLRHQIDQHTRSQEDLAAAVQASESSAGKR